MTSQSVPQHPTHRIHVQQLSETLDFPRLNLPTLPKGDFYAFHTMLKPTGASCNINCDYCFYLHKQDLLQQTKHPRMPSHVLEQHIRQYIEAQAGSPSVTFTWQGGEPTMMGIGFFEKILEIQQKYAPADMVIYHDLQTNGLLLDDAWCQFLAQHQFLVGISIDGNQALHDTYRRTNNDKPTFALVMQAIGLLKKYNIPFNALCVVNNVNAEHPLAVYRFLRDEVRPRMIQFLPAVEPVDFDNVAPLQWQPEHLVSQGNPRTQPGASDSIVTAWSVSDQQWGNFLTTIWQEWLNQDIGKVFVDQFENTIAQALGHGYQKCTTAPICGKALALEHNGDLYCCDHFVYRDFKLGNILTDHEGDLAFSEKQRKFAYLKQSTLPTQCKTCSVLALCWGDCPKHRFIKTATGDVGLNYLCHGVKQFYQQVLADLPVVMAKTGITAARAMPLP